MEWHNSVPGAVDQEGWSGIGTVPEMHKRSNSGTEMRRRRRQPGSVIVGSNANEDKGQTVTLLEEGQDKLRATVSGRSVGVRSRS